jgi:hypothetical protein
MKLTKSLVAGIVILANVSTAYAQKLDEVARTYPGENAVVLDKVMHYKIQVKNGEPYVESTETQKLLYLNTNVSYIGRYSFHHSTFHEVREYAAYTQTTSNKKVKVTDFQTSHSSSNSVFYDDTKETRFDFPSLAPGAIGNLEVSRVHTKAYLLSPYYFSRYIPVVRTELRITVSNDVGLKYKLKGLDTSFIKVKKEHKRNETTYVFYAENLKGEKTYPDAPDVSWYMPHVIFYIDHFRNEQGQKVPYLSNLEDLYRLNNGFISDVNRVPGHELKNLVATLVKSSSDNASKARNIYQWVQKHIKYIAFEDGMGGFVPRDANMVLHRRYGDCKDMASLLTMMLNAAGVPAYYTWIGTRDIAYSYHDVPLPIADNHMICTAELDGKMVFLDGTDANCVFGSVPSGIQDKEALVAINPKEYKVLKVPVQTGGKNLQYDSSYMEIGSNGIQGSIYNELKGYYAMDMHARMKAIAQRDLEEHIKSYFSRGSNKFRLEKFEVGEKTDLNELKLRAEFTLSDYAKKAGDEWFVNMNLQRFFLGEEIDFPKRKMPVEKEFLFENRYVVALKIPEGYTASYIPEGKSYRNELWGFDLSYRSEKGLVICTLQLTNNSLMIHADKFEQWNKVLEQLGPLYKEIVILSKK